MAPAPPTRRFVVLRTCFESPCSRAASCVHGGASLVRLRLQIAARCSQSVSTTEQLLCMVARALTSRDAINRPVNAVQRAHVGRARQYLSALSSASMTADLFRSCARCVAIALCLFALGPLWGNFRLLVLVARRLSAHVCCFGKLASTSETRLITAPSTTA
jgi:hypothetical protein